MSEPGDPSPARVLFVCTANRVRSPFAEAAARRMVDERGLPIRVASAGTDAQPLPAVVNMVEVAAKMGHDLGDHVSRAIDEDLTSGADLIVTMTGEHVMDVIAVDPGATDRTVTLRELAAAVERSGPPQWSPDQVRSWAQRVTDRPLGELLRGEVDVADPIGGPKRAYRRTAREITDLLARVLDASQNSGPALGVDHHGP